MEDRELTPTYVNTQHTADGTTGPRESLNLVLQQLVVHTEEKINLPPTLFHSQKSTPKNFRGKKGENLSVLRVVVNVLCQKCKIKADKLDDIKVKNFCSSKCHSTWNMERAFVERL